jgi:hypothetical protein
MLPFLNDGCTVVLGDQVKFWTPLLAPPTSSDVGGPGCQYNVNSHSYYRPRQAYTVYIFRLFVRSEVSNKYMVLCAQCSTTAQVQPAAELAAYPTRVSY